LSAFTDYLGGVVGVSGAVIAWVGYRRVRAWRASDLAQSLMSQLASDEELAFACHVLDWGLGPVIVPTRYRALLESQSSEPKKSPTERGEIMQLDMKMLAIAMRPRLKFSPEHAPQGLVYRYCFDKLFGHLTEVYRLLKAGRLDADDLYGLRYWLQRIAQYKYPPKDVRGKDVFQPFLRFKPFGYRPVMFLGHELGVKGWTIGWESVSRVGFTAVLALATHALMRRRFRLACSLLRRLGGL